MFHQSLFISNFSRFIVKILIPLLAGTAIAGVIFEKIFERYVILNSQNCGAYKVNRIIKATYIDEIPIFGSSRAEYCIIPDSLGNNYFNYGLAGTKYNVTLFFMEEECKKNKSKHKMIVNLDFESFSSGNGDIANYICNADYPPIRKILGNEYKKNYSIPFIKYFGLYETYLRYYLNQKIDITKIANKGAMLDKNVLPKKQFEELIRLRQSEVNTFIYDSVLVVRLLQLIKTNPQCKFVFVISPYHWSYFYNLTNYDDVMHLTNRLASINNVVLLDFSKSKYDDSLFLNTTHLNYKGAAVFSSMLRDTLRELHL